MKKLLLGLSMTFTMGLYAQVSDLIGASGLESNPQINSQQKTYTACSYIQENNAFENGRVSNVLFPLVCADDFIVPANECWDITHVVANFFTNNPTDATGINLIFYADNAGQPGAVVGTYVANPSDYTSSLLGTNFGLGIYEYDINVASPVNLCGGVTGTTFWFSAQVINTMATTDFYWEMTSLPTYGSNGMNAPSTAGPWFMEIADNFVFELSHSVVNNITLTECAGFSITVGTNTYNTTGVTTDVLVSIDGCDSTVNLDLTILPDITGTDVQVVCDSLVWIDGLTYYADNNVATFNLVGASINGCDSLVTLDLTVNGPDNGVTQTGQMLMTADEVGATYQWLDCSNAFMPIAAATNQAYTSTVAGSFAVEVTANGCVDTSNCVVVDFSSVGENQNSLISFYPNPAQNLIYVNGLNDLTGFVKMEIVSVTGAVVKVYSTVAGTLDVTQLSEGVYFINVYHEGGLESLRFVKE